MEDHLDSTASRQTKDGVMFTIGQGNYMVNIRGPDGKPFSQASGTEGRYTICFNIDGFDPGTNKQAGSQYSCQGMYAFCLDLPEDIRHLPENIYPIGLMPGPDKPSLAAGNHMLRPFIEDMLAAWRDGFYVSQTHKFPQGRLIRLALGPLVADMLGGRQAAGFAAPTAAKGCIHCDANWKTDLDYQNWKQRSETEYRRLAHEWLACPTTALRAAHFDLHQVRYSVLLLLPYWNPILMVPPDPMHIWFLGAFSILCRTFWGMNVNLDDDETGNHIPGVPKAVAVEHLTYGMTVLKSGSDVALTRLNADILKALCRSFDLTNTNTAGKDQLIILLRDLVRDCEFLYPTTDSLLKLI